VGHHSVKADTLCGLVLSNGTHTWHFDVDREPRCPMGVPGLVLGRLAAWGLGNVWQSLWTVVLRTR
jgi:hypothetical protein